MAKSLLEPIVIHFIGGARGNFIATLINTSLGKFNTDVDSYGSCHGSHRSLYDGSIIPDNMEKYKCIITHDIHGTMEGIEDSYIEDYKIVQIIVDREDLLEVMHNWLYKFAYGNLEDDKNQRKRKHARIWKDGFFKTIKKHSKIGMPELPNDFTRDQYATALFVIYRRMEIVYPDGFDIEGSTGTYFLNFKDTLNKDKLKEIVEWSGGKWNIGTELLYKEYKEAQKDYLFDLTPEEIEVIGRQNTIGLHRPS